VREIVLGTLEEQRIPYFITGSDALTLLGPGRSTVDTDVVIRLDPDGYELRLRPALEVRGAYVAALLTQPGRAVGQASLGPGWVDLIMPAEDAWTRACFERRVRLFDPSLGAEVWVISPEDLVIAKLRWDPRRGGRQFEDAVRLIHALSLDVDLLHAAATLTGTTESLNDALEAATHATE
jgi:hypothetical protein